MSQVYGYGRASTSKQVQSPTTQKMMIETYCARIGRKLGNFYVDAATSGKTNFAEREAAARMMSVLRRGDHVLVARLDRLSRSFIDFGITIEKLGNMGITLHILDMPGGVIDAANPMGMLLVHILAAFAQFERQLISVRTKEGHATLKALGRRSSMKPRFGFQFEKRADGLEYEVPEPNEARICMDALHLKRHKFSYDEVRQYLSYVAKEKTRFLESQNRGGTTRWTMGQVTRMVKYGVELERLAKEGKWTPLRSRLGEISPGQMEKISRSGGKWTDWRLMTIGSP